jgi:hypothetical protein
MKGGAGRLERRTRPHTLIKIGFTTIKDLDMRMLREELTLYKRGSI